MSLWQGSPPEKKRTAMTQEDGAAQPLVRAWTSKERPRLRQTLPSSGGGARYPEDRTGPRKRRGGTMPPQRQVGFFPPGGQGNSAAAPTRGRGARLGHKLGPELNETPK
ncbi:hypothetical protein NDU88_007524 [Pleurodeles waltl]|uniref:Uncharacterized protein n=1 Tax=Pleurodeles waltl TaxID=8319 RepID=A0AAV7RT53_PLEWA|nr:hypothetical protein NDU88_007524 [Pleurodeles waltl]